MALKTPDKGILSKGFLLWILCGVWMMCGVFYSDDSLYRTPGSASYFFLAFSVCGFAGFNLLQWFTGRKSIITNYRSVSFTWLDLFVLFFCLYVVICQSQADVFRMMKFDAFVFLCLLYVLFRTVPNKNQWMKQMQKAWVIITGIEALYGILQLFGMAFSNHAFFQTTGDFLNPGPFAGYLAIGLPVILKQVLDSSFSHNEDRKYWGFLSYISLMLVILILPATMSRAAWLAASAGCLCTCLMHKKFMEEIRQSLQKYVKFKKIIYLGLGGIVVVLIAGLIAAYQIKKDSADGRFIVWQVSAEIFKEYPLTGAGLGKFSVAYGEAQSAWFSSEERPEEVKMLADVPEYAFNEYVQVLSEWGLIGLLLFLSIMIFAVRPLWSPRFRTRRSAASGFTGSLIAFLVFSCFSYPLRLFPLTIICIFLLTLSASFQEEHRNNPINGWIPKIFSLVCFTLCLMMFPAQLPRQKAFKAWKSASFLYQGNIYREAAEEYAPLLKELGDQKDYLFEYGQSLSKSNQPEAGNRIFTQGLKFSSDPMFYNCIGNNYKVMGMYEQAEQAYLKAESIVPNRHYPLYLLAKLYFETGNTVKARATAEELLNKPVKIQTTAIEEMQDEIKTLLSTLP